MKPCNSCGKCCEKAGNGGLSASAEEINWWEIHRPDIFRYVDGNRIWVDPETSEYFPRCPWLRSSDDGWSFRCDIYHDRPEECRHYPIDIDQMLRDECEMLERRDLLDLKRAERKLAQIMIDSRPLAGDRY